MKQLCKIALILFSVSQLISCKKFLDEKPDKKLVTPSTLADLWAIMDHVNVMFVNNPWLDEMSADNIYYTQPVFNSLSEQERNVYLWKRENLYAVTNNWSHLYSKVYYANTVLEQLPKIERTALNATEWDNLKGQALMIRGNSFLQAVLIWANAYDAASAATDAGIPLRLNTNFAEPTSRATVAKTYEQLLNDLKGAAQLLSNTSFTNARASKPAAYGFISRAYLSMRNYEQAGLYADSSLKIYSTLVDYNTLNAGVNLPMPKKHPEITFLVSSYTLGLSTNYARIDSLLYSSYAITDCRKTVLFKTNADGTIGFKGTYVSGNGNFAGMATDEMYLVRAECFARAGNTAAAMADVNQLLKMRYKPGFVDLTASNADDALQMVLKERRKELLMRGLRWMDIKRLNKDRAGIIQQRKMNNEIFVLQPNSNGYALPIPDYVIEIAHIPQNP